MSTLAQLETRIAARLVDSANTVFSLTTVDEGLRTALSEYTIALPQTAETHIVLASTGREIALSSLTGLITVLDVWWPFDPATEVWPPNMVAGFRVWWNNNQPILFLASKSGNQPQAGDNLRLWYTKPHTIQNLDGGSATTVFPNHESALVGAAAGYAAASSQIDQIGTVRVDPSEVPGLNQWSASRLAEWRAFLASLVASAPSFGPPYGEGWGLDKWDANRSSSQARPWNNP